MVTSILTMLCWVGLFLCYTDYNCSLLYHTWLNNTVLALRYDVQFVSCTALHCTTLHCCSFIALIKRGDPLFAEYSNLLDKMNNTPIGLLEEQAKIRNFKTQFVSKSNIASLSRLSLWSLALSTSCMYMLLTMRRVLGS